MSRRQSYLLFISFFVAVVSAPACLWVYRFIIQQQLPMDVFKLHVHIPAESMTLDLPLLSGTQSIRVAPPVVDPLVQSAEIISTYERNPSASHAFNDRNDYAAALVFAGRYADAIAVLIAIERDYPEQYTTAANLGTAYELNGEVENAKVWIQKGIERNPNSHAGTEWLHLAILDAKLKLRQEPDWLKKHSVLEGQEKRTRAEKETALEYQLNERLNFIKENDPIMCDLFYQAAQITENPAKRAYYLRQVPRFGTIRGNGLELLIPMQNRN